MPYDSTVSKWHYNRTDFTKKMLLISRYRHLMTDIVFDDVKGHELVMKIFQLLPNLKSIGFVISKNATTTLSSCAVVKQPSVVRLSLNLAKDFVKAPNLHEFLKHLFLLMPNLTVITSNRGYENFGYVDNKLHQQIVKVINETAVDIPNLQKLDFNMKLRDDSAIECLVQKKFPLKKLDFTACSTVRLESIHNLLDHFSVTLESVTIRGATHSVDTGHYDFGRRVDVPDIGVPTVDEIFNRQIRTKLNNLTELQLVWLTGSLDVIHSLPKLKTLRLEQFHFGNKRELDNQQNGHGLQTLIVNCVGTPSCSRSFMESFLKQFPNLKQLQVDNVRDLPLSFILLNFQRLKSLKLQGSRLDSGAIRNAMKDVRHDKTADAPTTDTVECLEGEWLNHDGSVHSNSICFYFSCRQALKIWI